MSTRRQNHEGTFERSPKGKHRLRMSVAGRVLVGPWVSRKSEAKQAFREKFSQDPPPEESTQTLSIFATSWRATLSPGTYAPTTLDLHETNIRSRIIPDPIGRLPIATLAADPDHYVAAWLARQTGARSTVNNALDTLRAVLRSLNIKTTVIAPAKRASPQPWISNAQFDQLIKAAIEQGVDWRDPLICIMAFEMLLRREECCGLRHEDRMSNSVLLSQAAVRTSKGTVIKDLKTDSSKRFVPLPPALQEFVGKSTGFIIGIDADTPFSPAAFTYRVKRLLRLAGITLPGRTGAHTLRRGMATELLQHGIDVKRISRLGGMSIKILLEHYTQAEDLNHEAIAIARGQLTITKTITKPTEKE